MPDKVLIECNEAIILEIMDNRFDPTQIKISLSSHGELRLELLNNQHELRITPESRTSIGMEKEFTIK